MTWKGQAGESWGRCRYAGFQEKVRPEVRDRRQTKRAVLELKISEMAKYKPQMCPWLWVEKWREKTMTEMEIVSVLTWALYGRRKGQGAREVCGPLGNVLLLVGTSGQVEAWEHWS